MKLKKSYCLLVSALTSLYADGIDDFRLSLAETTKLATKSHLNVDYVPGTMNIVRGEELLAIGVTDLSMPNAFDSIIGMESISSSLRGSGAVFGGNGNKIKWMINGVSFETQIGGGQLWGKYPLVIPFPVEFIDRIEIIRGPGSALYGGNAIFGVINIITKRGSNTLFSTVGNKGGNNLSKTIGVMQTVTQGSVDVDLKASVTQDDGYDLFVPQEGRFASLWGSQAIPGYAAGKIPNYSLSKTLSTDIKGEHFQAWLYAWEMQSGQGLMGWAPTDPFPSYSENYTTKERTILSGVGYETTLGKNVISTKAGVNIFSNTVNNFMFYPLTTTTGDGVKNRRYSEQTSYVSVENQREYEAHTLTYGIKLKEIKVLDDRVDRFYELSYSSVPPFVVYTVSPLSTPVQGSLFEHKPKRYLWATFLQDEWQASEHFAVTIGGRFDSYNDVGSAFSPRIATVYNPDDKHIIKTQLSRAFRAPNLLEAYRDGYVPEKLRPETVDTIEASYVYKIPSGALKTTLFHSVIHNMIGVQDFSGFFINYNKDSTINGIEFEAEKKYNKHKLSFNLARYTTHHPEDRFVNTSHDVFLTRSGGFALSPEWMSAFSWTINPSTAYATTLSCHYIGEKPRRNGETTINDVLAFEDNGKIKAYGYLNVTQKIESNDRHWRGVVGVHNLLDKELQTLYMPLTPRDLTRSSAWPSNTLDIPYARRMIFATLSYSF